MLLSRFSLRKTTWTICLTCIQQIIVTLEKSIRNKAVLSIQYIVSTSQSFHKVRLTPTIWRHLDLDMFSPSSSIDSWRPARWGFPGKSAGRSPANFAESVGETHIFHWQQDGRGNGTGEATAGKSLILNNWELERALILVCSRPVENTFVKDQGLFRCGLTRTVAPAILLSMFGKPMFPRRILKSLQMIPGGILAGGTPTHWQIYGFTCPYSYGWPLRKSHVKKLRLKLWYTPR